ncbi:hypothetical protein ACHMW7_29535 [Aminobacter sp. UC22_36]|uniref:hypothetical protein n=1 Tax=Aminobacter sp. UC22_36 TaxID=3374549 RepID=UPI003757F3A8
MSELLGRVSIELVDIAAQVERLHPLVSAQSGQLAAGDPHYAQALQSFDHIEQKLRCLASYLNDLGAAAAPGWRLEPHAALAAITLSDLASRLAGQNSEPLRSASPGDFELF